jgi:heavy metal efflux system protein
MLTKIIEFSVRNKLIIGLFVLALIGYGSYQTTQLPIDAVPDITNNQVQVITTAPSFGATDIERLVTFPIEQANSNIQGLVEIRSFSRFGLSLVTIVFEDDIDVYWARQQVAERLQQVQGQIPEGIGQPTLGPVSTGLGEIYQYVVKPKKGYEHRYDETELRTIQDWIVRRQLLGVKGVADVSSFGGKVKQYEIAVNPNKLHAYGLTISDVFEAVEKNNQNTGGSYIEKGSTVLYIRTEGLIGTLEDIENITIAVPGRSLPLFLRDIAEVQTGFATRYGAMCYNDEGEVAGAVVMMLKGENSSEVIRNVKERIAKIQTTLPEGVEIEAFLDRTKMVKNAIGTVQKNLLEGALIVVFVLVLFLGNFRAGLLVASVIPLAMLFAISMMNLFGVSGNLMSLGALDFGLIVDGAVIIIEAVMHQLSHSRKFREAAILSGRQMDSQVTSAASKMMNSAVFGQIIILIVYLPILTLQGIEGKMFKPMAQTVAFALLGAFILSLTYIPMMSAFFLSKKIRKTPTLSDKVLHRVEGVYQRVLLRVLRYPRLVLGVVGMLLVSALLVLSTLGGEFIPALEEGDFAVDTRVLPGSNLNTTIQSTQQAAHILKTQFPEVEKIVTKIGSGEIPTDPMPMEASDLMIILKDKSEWTSAESFPELSAKMSTALEAVPGITTGFQFPVQMRFNELMTGARQDVVCKIFGENLDTLAAQAARLGKLVGTVEGAENIFVEPVTGMPQIIIKYNRPLIAQYRLSIAEVNRTIHTAFAGQSAGLLFEEEKRFDVVVRLATADRKNIEDVRNLLIPTPLGTQIPLSQVANVEIKDGPNQIQREDAKRRIVVGFNVKGRDVQSIVEEVQRKASTQLELPTGYFITYGGAFENLNEAKKRLFIAVPVSLLLIFILLFFAFNSVRQGLLIYTAIPLSAIGGIFVLALRGMPFSISAGVGFIALFGVAVLNGIVLIAEFNSLRKSGLKNVALIVLRGTRVRLRPVLMTASVASLGFLPMALSNGAGAEVQRPLATVVIGGLLVATFLTLFVLPVLYTLFEKGIKTRPSVPKKVLASLLLVLVSLSSYGQKTEVGLEEAVAQALANNRVLQTESQRAEYFKVLSRATADIPNLNATMEYGQLNSAYTDTRFAVAQSVAFPRVYATQKQVRTEEWRSSLLQVALREHDLRRAVTQTFSEVAVLKEKQKLLLKADSLYNQFYQKAALRVQKGESTVLEKTTAQSQLSSIRIQLRQLQQALDRALLDLKLLLNTPGLLEPRAGSLKVPLLSRPDSSGLSSHPVLRVMQQQGTIARAQTAAEKAKLLPDLTIGFQNISFTGVGADNKSYSPGNRFYAVQAGVGIPVFTRSQRARIEASRLQEQIAQSTYQAQFHSLENQHQQLLLRYSSSQEIIQQMEANDLPNALLIGRTAAEQFQQGEINYLDFVILTNQALAIQSQYLDALQQFNESTIALNFISSH